MSARHGQDAGLLGDQVVYAVDAGAKQFEGAAVGELREEVLNVTPAAIRNIQIGLRRHSQHIRNER